MKKILLTIFMVLFTSACVSNSNDSNNINNNIDYAHLTKRDIKVVKFNYNNHQYLYFIPYNTLAEASVVHDPDCPCNKNNSM